MISQATASSNPLSSIIPIPNVWELVPWILWDAFICLHASCNSLFNLKFFCHWFLWAVALLCSTVLGNRTRGFSLCSVMLSLIQAAHARALTGLGKSLDRSVSEHWAALPCSDKWLLTHQRRYSCSQCAHRALPSRPVLLICKYAGGRFFY